MDWIQRLATRLEPIQQNIADTVPLNSQMIAAHIHIPIFFAPLQFTDFPNPDHAFRLFKGAPLVGVLESPALLERQSLGKTFTTKNLISVAMSCQRQEDFVKPRLSAEAADKSMEKMDKEYATRTLVFVSFRRKEDMVAAMIRLIRQFPGLSDFDLYPSLIPASPQLSVEESHAYQEDNVEEMKNEHFCNHFVFFHFQT